MEIIEKIRKYIENLYDGEAPAHDQQCEFEDGYFTGIATISKFLDSLQEETPTDLEEEIVEYWKVMGWSKVISLSKFKVIARYFYGLGQLNSK